jgi:hypothetical protein
MVRRGNTAFIEAELPRFALSLTPSHLLSTPNLDAQSLSALRFSQHGSVYGSVYGSGCPISTPNLSLLYVSLNMVLSMVLDAQSLFALGFSQHGSVYSSVYGSPPASALSLYLYKHKDLSLSNDLHAHHNPLKPPKDRGHWTRTTEVVAVVVRLI